MEESDRLVEQQLSDFLADLVTDKESVLVVSRILALEKGQWASVQSICEGLDLTLARYSEIMSTTESQVMVTRLDHPYGFYEYCFILFYLEDEMFSYVVIINEAMFRGVS